MGHAWWISLHQQSLFLDLQRRESSPTWLGALQFVVLAALGGAVPNTVGRAVTPSAKPFGCLAVPRSPFVSVH
jgi:hypothetical protein